MWTVFLKRFLCLSIISPFVFKFFFILLNKVFGKVVDTKFESNQVFLSHTTEDVTTFFYILILLIFALCTLIDMYLFNLMNFDPML